MGSSRAEDVWDAWSFFKMLDLDDSASAKNGSTSGASDFHFLSPPAVLYHDKFRTYGLGSEALPDAPGGGAVDIEDPDN